MLDNFYVIKRNNTFQLRLTDTFFCVSTSSTLEGVLENLKRIVRKYRTYIRYSSALAGTEHRGIIKNAKEHERQQKIFEKESGHFEISVKEAIYEALEEVKADSFASRSAKKIKLISRHLTTHEPVEVKIESTPEPVKRVKGLFSFKKLSI